MTCCSPTYNKGLYPAPVNSKLSSTVHADAAPCGIFVAEKFSVIFICPFDKFQEGRHIYTFHETCTECPNIKLDDGTTKIFLSTQGIADDVDSDVKAFLNYVDSGVVVGEFVQKIDKAVKIVKSNRRAMKEFMTYEMSLLEREKRGVLQGRNQEKEFFALKMIKKGSSMEDIQEMTELPLSRIKELIEQISDKP